MGWDIDWGKLLERLIIEIAKPLLKTVLDMVVDLIDQWADRMVCPASSQ